MEDFGKYPLSVSKSTQALPTYVLKDSVPVYDKTEVLNCFNKHFISSGSLLDSVGSFSDEPLTDLPAFSFCTLLCSRSS